MSKHSQATLQKDEKKTSLTLQNQEVDTPILPVEQMERLHSFCPEGVKWILEQTQIEAEHRRKETSRVNIFIFIEHLLGQIFGFLIGIAGVIGGVLPRSMIIRKQEQRLLLLQSGLLLSPLSAN